MAICRPSTRPTSSLSLSLCQRRCLHRKNEEVLRRSSQGALERIRRSSKIVYLSVLPLTRSPEPENLVSLLELEASIVPQDGVGERLRPYSTLDEDEGLITTLSLERLLAASPPPSVIDSDWSLDRCLDTKEGDVATRGAPMTFFDYFAPNDDDTRLWIERMTTLPPLQPRLATRCLPDEHAFSTLMHSSKTEQPQSQSSRFSDGHHHVDGPLMQNAKLEDHPGLGPGIYESEEELLHVLQCRWYLGMHVAPSEPLGYHASALSKALSGVSQTLPAATCTSEQRHLQHIDNHQPDSHRSGEVEEHYEDLPATVHGTGLSTHPFACWRSSPGSTLSSATETDRTESSFSSRDISPSFSPDTLLSEPPPAAEAPDFLEPSSRTKRAAGLLDDFSLSSADRGIYTQSCSRRPSTASGCSMRSRLSTEALKSDSHSSYDTIGSRLPLSTCESFPPVPPRSPPKKRLIRAAAKNLETELIVSMERRKSQQAHVEELESDPDAISCEMDGAKKVQMKAAAARNSNRTRLHRSKTLSYAPTSLKDNSEAKRSKAGLTEIISLLEATQVPPARLASAPRTPKENEDLKAQKPEASMQEVKPSTAKAGKIQEAASTARETTDTSSTSTVFKRCSITALRPKTPSSFRKFSFSSLLRGKKSEATLSETAKPSSEAQTAPKPSIVEVQDSTKKSMPKNSSSTRSTAERSPPKKRGAGKGSYKKGTAKKGLPDKGMLGKSSLAKNSPIKSSPKKDSPKDKEVQAEGAGVVYAQMYNLAKDLVQLQDTMAGGRSGCEPGSGATAQPAIPPRDASNKGTKVSTSFSKRSTHKDALSSPTKAGRRRQSIRASPKRPTRKPSPSASELKQNTSVSGSHSSQTTIIAPVPKRGSIDLEAMLNSNVLAAPPLNVSRPPVKKTSTESEVTVVACPKIPPRVTADASASLQPTATGDGGTKRSHRRSSGSDTAICSGILFENPESTIVAIDSMTDDEAAKAAVAPVATGKADEAQDPVQDWVSWTFGMADLPPSNVVVIQRQESEVLDPMQVDGAIQQSQDTGQASAKEPTKAPQVAPSPADDNGPSPEGPENAAAVLPAPSAQPSKDSIPAPEAAEPKDADATSTASSEPASEPPPPPSKTERLPLRQPSPIRYTAADLCEKDTSLDGLDWSIQCLASLGA